MLIPSLLSPFKPHVDNENVYSPQTIYLSSYAVKSKWSNSCKCYYYILSGRVHICTNN